MSVTKISFFLRRAFVAARIITFFHLVLLFFICEEGFSWILDYFDNTKFIFIMDKGYKPKGFVLLV